MDYPKVPQEINNIVGDNVKLLAQLFPSAVKDGQVDLEALKEELGQFEEVDKEKYELTWAGKQDAKKKAQEDVYNRTLNYIESDSKNPEITENLYIEGDNLEVLKLLRQNYYGAIKMIYIDPPYNTGNDFVYNDNFAMSSKESDIAEGTRDDEGNPLQRNQQSSNRYHANWLNMMYPRLKIAKDLLKDDGVIFISIDENEINALKTILDEIFGAGNFLTTLNIKLRHEDRILKGDKDFHEVVEYCLIYKKGTDYTQIKRVADNTSIEDYIYEIIEISEPEKIIKLGNKDVAVFNPNQYLANKTNPKETSLKKVNIRGTLKDGNSSGRFYMNYLDSITDDFGYLYKVPDIGDDIFDYRYFVKPSSEKFLNGSYFQGVPVNRSDTKELPYPNFLDMVNEFNNVGYEGDVVFRNGKKPISFLLHLMKLAGIENEKQCICLDFFSGSASFGEAMMKFNQDGGKRKFICVQIPENLDKSLDLADNNTKPSISASITFLDSIKKPHILTEIGKERLRRSGEKIKQEIEAANAMLKIGEEPTQVPDIGFKVFRTADTNIKWNLYNSLGQLDTSAMTHTPDLADFTMGFNDIDVVYEVMLRQKDVPLSSTLETLTDIGSRTYLYGSAYLVCLETEITEELIDKLATLDPLPIKFVFRDSAFKDDINLKDETFRRLKNLIERNSGLEKKSYTVEFI
ncbi:site-specific DNA-methyltransferase [Dehalobacterium formicoaceticum]|uniref:site-specific DNA-methyltransferase n=1 Tax=Dehalobacterium formicoaceticum TaxID=51515 RepID=UPI000B7E444F|nr:site-specific DNA-methyltransferase [Dehalobacterium formicoaceticum]